MYVTGLLLYLNSTINPVIYNLISAKYRKAFKETLFNPSTCCRWIHQIHIFMVVNESFKTMIFLNLVLLIYFFVFHLNNHVFSPRKIVLYKNVCIGITISQKPLMSVSQFLKTPLWVTFTYSVTEIILLQFESFIFKEKNVYLQIFQTSRHFLW